MGRDDVVALLERNLGSEQSTLEKARAMQAEVAAVTLKAAWFRRGPAVIGLASGVSHGPRPPGSHPEETRP